ncbi:hypothetical protein DdX_05471 [Ditylenchus destructor]|uniref:Uncharacterized protein n=1 Tax=Ditylenchus destructor TaxID=166010 RepID=A0AAD4N910_9BILA|nr:hypothetical protein DdX_05471 [Ditylenchus destructor]
MIVLIILITFICFTNAAYELRVLDTLANTGQTFDLKIESSNERIGEYLVNAFINELKLDQNLERTFSLYLIPGTLHNIKQYYTDTAIRTRQQNKSSRPGADLYQVLRCSDEHLSAQMLRNRSISNAKMLRCSDLFLSISVYIKNAQMLRRICSDAQKTAFSEHFSLYQKFLSTGNAQMSTKILRRFFV